MKEEIISTLFEVYAFDKDKLSSFYDRLVSLVGPNNKGIGKALEYAIQKASAEATDPFEVLDDLFKAELFSSHIEYGFMSRVKYNDSWFILINSNKDGISYSINQTPEENDQWRSLSEYLHLVSASGVM